MKFKCKICNRQIGANAMGFWTHLNKNGKAMDKQPNHYPEPEASPIFPKGKMDHKCEALIGRGEKGEKRE